MSGQDDGTAAAKDPHVPSISAATDAAILAGLARARCGSLHFPAYFSGLSFDDVEDGTCTVNLDAQPQVVDSHGDFSSMAIALMCDLSLGSAIRSRIGKRPALPTISLIFDYTLFPVRANRLLCEAIFLDRVGDFVTAQCVVKTGGGAMVGRARGAFLVQPRQSRAGFTKFPWEADDSKPLTAALLTQSERRVRSFLLQGLKARDNRARLSGMHERLYQISASADKRAGTATLVQPVGPHLANRTGHVQGGVIAGLLTDACRAAARPADRPLGRLASMSCTFMRPGRLERRTITARAETVFDGRRLQCVSATATDDEGTQLARAEAVLVSAPDLQGHCKEALRP